MGISSALNAGVMGLNVNGSKLSTISDNIANSGTKGYKRADVEFSNLVMTERPTSYDAGGVRGTTVRDIDQRGAILSTTNVGDIAIGGAGFLPVTDRSLVDKTVNLPLKLTTTGSFRPDAQGVMTSATGLTLMGWAADANGVVTPPNRESSAGLEPVQIKNLAIASDPTSEIKLAVNLPSSVTGPTTPADRQSLSLPVEYFGALGGSDTVSIQFSNFTTDRTVTAPYAQTSLPANEWNFELFPSEEGALNQVLNETPIASYRLTFSASPTSGGVLTRIEEVANDGTLTGNFSQFATPDDPTTALTDSLAAYDPASGELSTQVNGQDIVIDIGRLTTNDGFQQLDTDFTVIEIEKNGSPASPLIGIEINQRGFLDAIFESGFRRTLYQIPVGAVPNTRGLAAEDGQAFTITPQSGGVYFFNAGEGPTGRMVSFALEESTTDIAQELTDLIKTQRAYSSNAKIIQTVDEMLQETTNLKR